MWIRICECMNVCCSLWLLLFLFLILTEQSERSFFHFALFLPFAWLSNRPKAVFGMKAMRLFFSLSVYAFHKFQLFAQTKLNTGLNTIFRIHENTTKRSAHKSTHISNIWNECARRSVYECYMRTNKMQHIYFFRHSVNSSENFSLKKMLSFSLCFHQHFPKIFQKLWNKQPTKGRTFEYWWFFSGTSISFSTHTNTLSWCCRKCSFGSFVVKYLICLEWEHFMRLLLKHVGFVGLSGFSHLAIYLFILYTHACVWMLPSNRFVEMEKATSEISSSLCTITD